MTKRADEEDKQSKVSVPAREMASAGSRWLLHEAIPNPRKWSPSYSWVWGRWGVEVIMLSFPAAQTKLIE